MNNLFKVSVYTYRQIIKSKILIVSSILSLVVAIATFVAAEFTYSTHLRVMLDVSLGFMNLLSVGVAIFLGVNLISDEVKNRTLYFMLSRPISRTSFILGKILGMFFIIVSIILIMTAITSLLILPSIGQYFSDFIIAILFTTAESILLLLLVVIFSLISNKIISVLSVISLYISGNVINTIKAIAINKNQDWLLWITEKYRYLLPDFSIINFKPYVIYKHAVPEGFIFSGFAYIFILTVIYLIIMSLLFDKKELD